MLTINLSYIRLFILLFDRFKFDFFRFSTTLSTLRYLFCSFWWRRFFLFDSSFWVGLIQIFRKPTIILFLFFFRKLILVFLSSWFPIWLYLEFILKSLGLILSIQRYLFFLFFSWFSFKVFCWNIFIFRLSLSFFDVFLIFWLSF